MQNDEGTARRMHSDEAANCAVYKVVGSSTGIKRFYIFFKAFTLFGIVIAIKKVYYLRCRKKRYTKLNLCDSQALRLCRRPMVWDWLRFIYQFVNFELSGIPLVVSVSL